MKRVLAILIPVLVLGCLIAWRISVKNAEVTAMAGQRNARGKGPAAASLAPVEVKDLVRLYEATGSLEAPMNVKIAPKITGRIEMLNVREGEPVRSGQVLVKIDSSDVEANVREQMAGLAEAQYRLAQAKMNQTPSDVSVNTQIRQQKAGLSSAEADYRQIQATNKAQLAAAEADINDAQAKIDNATASVNSARASLENAKTKYNRTYSLYQKGYIAAQDVDDAKAAVTVQESAVEIAQGQLASAKASKESAQQQYNVTRSKGLADIESARARRIQTRASLDYAKANTSQKAAYRQSIAALQASVDAAEASLQSAKAKRADTVLTSPLNGYVTGRYSDPGAIASPSQPILAVQFMKTIWISISVPEDVCSKLRIGQQTSVKIDAFTNKTFAAKIVQINPAADPESRQFTVRMAMDNSQNMFKPGMFAHVSLELDRIKNAVVVPREAVQKDKDGQYVMTLDKSSKAVRVAVNPAGEDENYIDVGNALQPGQKVVVMSSMPVREGQQVMSGNRKNRGSRGNNR